MWHPKFSRWATPEKRSQLFALAVRVSDLIDPVPAVVAAPDPDDNGFLALAAAIDAKFLVTGDKALRSVRRFGSTDILTPGEFLARH